MAQSGLMPHDLDAEKITLGVILVEQAQLFQVQEIINTNDYYLEAHRIIFDTISDMRRADAPIDMMTVKNELQRTNRLAAAGGVPYLASLTDGVMGAINVRHYAQIVRETSLSRQVAIMTTAVTRRCIEGQERVRDIIADLQASVLQLSLVGVTRGPKPAGEYVDVAFREIEESASNKKIIIGLDTGFTRLNRITKGFQPGQLIILAARPGEGKTSFACNIVDHVAAIRKQACLFFSLEMTGRELAHRSICSMTPLDSHAIPRGGLDWQRIGEVCDMLHQAPLWIDDQAGITISELRARTHRVAARGQIGLIVVDYLQLMSGSSKRHENRDREISDITQKLKQLAKEVQAPILALSQLNRAIEKSNKPRRPQLSDLRESGSIEQDADVVLFLWRESEIASTKVVVAKNRSGPSGIDYEVNFDREYTRFTEPE